MFFRTQYSASRRMLIEGPGRKLFLATTLTCSLLLTGCAGDGKGAEAKPAAEAKEPSRVFTVRTQPVETQPVSYEIQAVGELVEERRFEIPARVQGVIADVSFREGDSVTTGQQLCRIDYDRFSLLVEQAQNQVKEAEAVLRSAEAGLVNTIRETSTSVTNARLTLELAESEFQRRSARGANAFTSPEERDQFESRYKKAQSDYRDAQGAQVTLTALARAQLAEKQSLLDSSRATLQLAQDDLERSIVRAPIEGTMQSREVVDGQFVNEGAVIGLMVEDNPLRLRFTVPESRAAKLSEDMDLHFSVPAHPNETFTGAVYEIGRITDPDIREVTCWARVENSDRTLRPGYFAHVDLVAETRDMAIVVPLASVLPTEKGMVAFVIQDGRAVRRVVKTGLHVTGDAVEVLEGLEPGERLVVEGMSSLQDGVPVKEVQGTSTIALPPEETTAAAVTNTSAATVKSGG